MPSDLQTNSTFNAVAESEYLTSRTGPWTSKPSTALAFLALDQVANNGRTIPLTGHAYGDTSRFYPSTYDYTLQAGYELQYISTLDFFHYNTTSAIEILNDNSGGLDIALMHPLSRGTTHIVTSDPLAPPSVDPRWLVNPFDLTVMQYAMRFNQKLLNTAPVQELGPSYRDFPANATMDQMAAILKSGIGTEFHYAGTAALMPRELGGVVDTNLIVYGTANLRVVDTSVFPVIPGAHLQAVTYAVAERAADILKGVSVDEAREALAEEIPAQAFWSWFVQSLGLDGRQAK